MTPIEINEKTNEQKEFDQLKKDFLKMPELENQDVEKHIWLNDINTFQSYKNEFCLRGVDEDGKDLTIWFDSYDFLKWVDKSKIDYIKENLIKYLKNK